MTKATALVLLATLAALVVGTRVPAGQGPSLGGRPTAATLPDGGDFVVSSDPPDRSWKSWLAQRVWPGSWALRGSRGPLQRVRVTPLLPGGGRAAAAELLLPPSQIAAEGLRPDPGAAGLRGASGASLSDGSLRSRGRGRPREAPWRAYNSSEATPLVPASLAWMTDSAEMAVRAGGGGLDISVARRLSELVAASYCNEGNLPAWNCSRCGPGFAMRRAVFDPGWDLLGFVGYSQELDAVVVAFRGTDSHSLYNWVENMRTWRTDLALSYPGMPPHALVHGGFFYSYNASFLAANVSAAVAELVAERAAAPRGGGGGAGGGWRRRAALGASAAPTVFVTGHSLGGALATLCALSLRLDLGLPDVRVVTFGSPRVGNGVFAAWFDSAVGPHWRFTHDRDIVPSLPPGYLGFAHVGGEVWVVDRLLRGRTLVGVCADGGGAGEDARCHASVCHLGLCASLADHLLYLSEMYSPHPDGC